MYVCIHVALMADGALQPICMYACMAACNPRVSGYSEGMYMASAWSDLGQWISIRYSTSIASQIIQHTHTHLWSHCIDFTVRDIFVLNDGSNIYYLHVMVCFLWVNWLRPYYGTFQTLRVQLACMYVCICVCVNGCVCVCVCVYVCEWVSECKCTLHESLAMFTHKQQTLNKHSQTQQ